MIMQIETIESVDRLCDIELDWDELYKSDPHAHFYLSSLFTTAVAMRAQNKFRILAAWSQDGRCIGILPLVVTIRWSKSAQCLYNVLDMLGHVFDADYTGILCLPEMENEVCQAFAHTVSQMSFARIILNYFSSPGSRMDTFTRAFPPSLFEWKHNTHFINDGQTNNLICPYIDLPDSFPAYLETLSANTRQKIRRLMRQLDQDPHLKIRRSQPETYTQDVSILAQLWYRKHVKSKGKKRATYLAELFKEVVMLGLAAGTVYLVILWHGDKPIAAQANYYDRVKRQILFHVSGRDESVRDVSAGLALQIHCIRWAIANGCERYDFTIGDEPYKYSLGAVSRPITSAEVFTKTGTNTTERLDESVREDVVNIVHQFAKKGRHAEAHIAAKQALLTWPDLESDHDIKALGTNVDAT